MARLIKNGNNFAAPAQEWEVQDEDELQTLMALVPGSIAYTKGYKKIWMKSADGTWAQV